MNKDSIADYLSCILFKLLGPILRKLPLSFVLFLGRRIGDLLFYFDLKHKAIAYANIKTALGGNFTPHQLSKTTKEFYQAFGQNIIEVFLIPLVNQDYLRKYVHFEGLEHIDKGFIKGKGVILLAAHEGSWELYNSICANLGFPFVLFVAGQKLPRLNKLLNSYRLLKNCRIIPRENSLRPLLEAIKDNQAIGMMVDQGGKTGTLVNFFGKAASMSTGAIKLGLKYGVTVIPASYQRVRGPYVNIKVYPALTLKDSGDLDNDIQGYLQEAVNVYERFIRDNPKEYLWTYKIWKYSNQKKILILNDGKTGHTRQSQAVALIISENLKERNIQVSVDNLEIKFKKSFSNSALNFSTSLAGKYHCQGCLWCLRAFLAPEVYQQLVSLKPDIIISCGSSIAPINYVLSRESLAKSIVVMRPGLLSTKRFDLVVIPRHDNPPKRKNVVVTEGALNLIGQQYLKEQAQRMLQLSVVSGQLSEFCIGLLVGGDTKDFRLEKETMLQVLKQIKVAADKLNADILVTTSRRTSQEIDELVKSEFSNCPRCKLLVIANEKNIPEAVGGILGLSQIVITSPESISMVSEAASSGKYALAFDAAGLGKRHRMFLEYLAGNKYIYLSDAKDLTTKIEELWKNKPRVNNLSDRLLVSQALKKIL